MDTSNIYHEEPSLEEVAIEHYENPTYRGAAAVDSFYPSSRFGGGPSFMQPSWTAVVPSDNQKFTTQAVEKPKLAKHSMAPQLSIFSAADTAWDINDLFPPASINFASDSSVPNKPFYLMPTHFPCNADIDTIVSSVMRCLNAVSEIAYEFKANIYKWSAVYVRDSLYCNFEIFIYRDGAESSYLVEANRLSGDASAFFPVYNELKNVLMGNHDESRSFDSFASTVPMPGASDASLSDAEAKTAFLPIQKMSEDENPEAHFIAAQILCDLTLQDGIHRQLCDNHGIQILAKFVKSDSERICRLAILALANLSEAHICQNGIISAGILPNLLKFATDGPYQSTEMRRAAARIIANISFRLADAVASSMNRSELTEWMDGVGRIDDIKLRFHADRARSSLALSAIMTM